MQYHYLALEQNNRLVRGSLEASSEGLAEDLLLQKGLRVITVRPLTRSRWVRRFKLSGSAVTRKELGFFSWQLATLLNAGTPLLSALQLLADETRNTSFKATLTGVIASLRAGMSLHEAMEKSPRVFPQVYVRLVDASERSGTLEQTLRQLATYLQREIAWLTQARKALSYPAIVAGVAVVVVSVLVTVVLPSFAEMLTSFNVELPLITRLVIQFSNAVQAWKLPALLFMVLVVGVGGWYLRRPEGRNKVDRLLLRAPGIGRFIVQLGLARFSRTMSILLNSGLPAHECLDLARYSSGNRVFQGAILHVRTLVLEGQTLSQAFSAVPFMPRIYVQLVKVGEESGTLEASLRTMADLYEREVEDRLSTMTSLVEPAVTVVMGVVIAGIALAVMLPMLSVFDTLQTP